MNRIITLSSLKLKVTYQGQAFICLKNTFVRVRVICNQLYEMLLVNACTVIYICLYGYRRTVIICHLIV